MLPIVCRLMYRDLNMLANSVGGRSACLDAYGEDGNDASNKAAIRWGFRGAPLGTDPVHQPLRSRP